MKTRDGGGEYRWTLAHAYNDRDHWHNHERERKRILNVSQPRSDVFSYDFDEWFRQ